MGSVCSRRGPRANDAVGRHMAHRSGLIARPLGAGLTLHQQLPDTRLDPEDDGDRFATDEQRRAYGFEYYPMTSLTPPPEDDDSPLWRWQLFVRRLWESSQSTRRWYRILTKVRRIRLMQRVFAYSGQFLHSNAAGHPYIRALIRVIWPGASKNSARRKALADLRAARPIF